MDVMSNLGDGEKFSSVNQYITNLTGILSTVVNVVQTHQARALGQQKSAFDVKINFQYYSEGELVWLRNNAKKRGLCPKLQRRFKGPYKIMERITEVLYRISPVQGG